MRDIRELLGRSPEMLLRELEGEPGVEGQMKYTEEKREECQKAASTPEVRPVDLAVKRETLHHSQQHAYRTASNDKFSRVVTVSQVLFLRLAK